MFFPKLQHGNKQKPLNFCLVVWLLFIDTVRKGSMAWRQHNYLQLKTHIIISMPLIARRNINVSWLNESFSGSLPLLDAQKLLFFFTSAYGVAFHQTAAVQLAFFCCRCFNYKLFNWFVFSFFFTSVPLVSNKVTQTKQCGKIKPPPLRNNPPLNIGAN